MGSQNLDNNRGFPLHSHACESDAPKTTYVSRPIALTFSSADTETAADDESYLPVPNRRRLLPLRWNFVHCISQGEQQWIHRRHNLRKTWWQRKDGFKSKLNNKEQVSLWWDCVRCQLINISFRVPEYYRCQEWEKDEGRMHMVMKYLDDFWKKQKFKCSYCCTFRLSFGACSSNRRFRLV